MGTDWDAWEERQKKASKDAARDEMERRAREKIKRESGGGSSDSGC